MTATAAATDDIWKQLVASLKTKLSAETFETWFSLIEVQAADHSAKKIVLRAPNEVVRKWVNTNFSALLNETIADLGLPGFSTAWVDEPAVTPLFRTQDISSAAAFSDAQLELAPVSRELNTADPPKPFVKQATTPDTKTFDPSLNSKYSYEGFVVGSCNQFAHAASLAVAEAPGKTYNPLYIYGGVGLGKTHLMHACGHAIKQRNPHLRLCYLSSEKFMNELINAIRYDKTPAFRERYRSVDVLLIDDVQFMAGKERTQEEFFHTFNSLYDQQKQIVISSDCPPREIPTLEERLHSRFEWGLFFKIVY